MKNDTEKMNIVFASDNNYAQLMGVALCSIFENKKGNYYINIYVLDGGISKININRLKILETKYNFEIKYIPIETSFFKNLYIYKHYSQAIYYRIMIPKIFPSLDKVLYLDCDIVAIDDIYDLYITDIKNFAFAGIGDEYLSKTRNKDLGMPVGEKYYNSGVLLINISKCIEINATDKIIDFINKYPEKLKYPDQDAINATMWMNFLSLDIKYNYISWINEEIKPGNSHIVENIKIIHYAEKKPWNYFSKNILNIKYFYYLNKTPWKNFKYINFYRERRKIFLINLLSYFKKVLSSIFSKKITEKIRIIKRKLDIKFY